MAHISGLIAAEEYGNPFIHSHVISSTTHKSLRGPRAGIVFARKEGGLNEKIDTAVFPMLQGGPHENVIGALAAQLLQASKPEFKDYIIQVKKNAKAMADELMSLGHTLVTGGTDNHLMLLNVRERGLTGSKFEKMCDAIHITLNKNTIIGDKSAITPGGVRIGTPAITTRGYDESDSRQVAKFLDRACKLSIEIQEKEGKKLNDFVAALEHNGGVKQLAADVEGFATQFPIPGFEVGKL